MSVEIYIPIRTEALEENFFARHADIVATDLLGRTLVREKPYAATLYAVINEIAAFEGSQEDSMTEGAVYAPGTFSVSTKHGKRMLDISTYEVCKPSCITLISALIGDQRGVREFVEGPIIEMVALLLTINLKIYTRRAETGAIQCYTLDGKCPNLPTASIWCSNRHYQVVDNNNIDNVVPLVRQLV